MKKILTSLSFLALACFASNASALGSEELIVRDFNKKASAAIKTIADSSLIKVTYVGASTQAAVVVTADAFGTEAPIGTSDLSFDTSNASYNTLGELCDAIEAEDDYTCALTGGKRDDDATLLQIVTAAIATDAKAAGGYEVLIDTGGLVVTDPYIISLGITPSSGKRVVLKYCTGNINVIDKLVIYGKLAKYENSTDGVTRGDITKVYQSPATADDTDKTIGNIYGVNFLEFAKDAHVVIRNLDADSTQAAANFIECVWDEK